MMSILSVVLSRRADHYIYLLSLIDYLSCNSSHVERQVVNCSSCLQPGVSVECFGSLSVTTLPVAENCAAVLPVAATAMVAGLYRAELLS